MKLEQLLTKLYEFEKDEDVVDELYNDVNSVFVQDDKIVISSGKLERNKINSGNWKFRFLKSLSVIKDVIESTVDLQSKNKKLIAYIKKVANEKDGVLGDLAKKLVDSQKDIENNVNKIKELQKKFMSKLEDDENGSD